MLLALDTSGPFCSALVATHSGVAAVKSENIGRGHAERLMPMIAELQQEADFVWPDIERIGCVNGPGSFTGLRVGLATARGLALALNVPCVGVTVFDAFANQYADEDELTVVMDAKRDQVWIQGFARGAIAKAPPTALPIDQAVPKIVSCPRIAGSGAPFFSQQTTDLEIVSDAPSPPIEAVARIAAMADIRSALPNPLYLRSPDAKPQSIPAPVA